MPIQNRTVTIKGVFAQDALTTIPPNPVVGTSYRDTGISADDIKKGWPFKEIVDSSHFNEHMYEESTIAKLVETYGFLPWSNLTDYEKGSYSLGTNGAIYRAKQNTGPSSTAFDPVNDTSGTYWELIFGASDLYFLQRNIQVVDNLPANPEVNTLYFVRG